MPTWISVLVIALGGGMLIEGAMYALFPQGMKKAMREMQALPDSVLRQIGLGVCVVGVLIVTLFMPK